MGSTEQHYSLRWNDYTVKIVTAFQSLRDEEDFVDVTVACDGHHYSAHKMVLSACSPYFRSLLRANPCQHPIVILKDVGHLEMERLLEFMYNGEVNIAQDQLAAFLKTAENLKIRGLAGSSEEMEQNQNKDIINNSNTINNTSGPTSGKTSPSAGFGSNMVAKEEDVSLDTSSVTYQNKLESPPSKRRKRIIAPATSQADNNTTSHSTDGILTESAVDMDGTGVGGGGLSMEDDLRMIDRREMKPEPTDALCEVYSDTTDLDGQHQGDQVDQRPVMYPIGIAGPSGTGSVGSQENLSSQEPGAPGSAGCEALNLSLRPPSSISYTNGVLIPAPSMSLHPLSQHRLRQPVSSVATAVISHASSNLEPTEDVDKKQFVEFVYPDVRFGVSHCEKVGPIEMMDRGPISSANQIYDNAVLTNTSGHEFKAKTYPCQECHKVFRHPMSLHHHRHVHKGTYTCESCGKVFSRRWDLHRHIHRSKMGCRRPNNVTTPVVSHCQDFNLDLNNPPSN